MIELLKKLIACESHTPDNSDCLKIIAEYLIALGGQVQWLPFEGINNLWVQFGTKGPLTVFAGHTDVVVAGPAEAWHHDPYTLYSQNGKLYGRGIADMKGSIVAMISAFERVLKSHELGWPQRFAFLLTADEEGPAIHGTAKVVDWIQSQHIQVSHCIVGEPSSDQKIGDTLRIGRRGSLHGHVVFQGRAGHVAYPETADNVIHDMNRAMGSILAINWPSPVKPFPPLSIQMLQIVSDSGATNVTPSQGHFKFNIRYPINVEASMIKEKIMQVLSAYQCTYHWQDAALPFYTTPGSFVNICQTAIEEITGDQTTLDASGGTSDARFMGPLGAQVVELGLRHESIHQVNEYSSLAEIQLLASIYESILRRLT